MKKNITIAALIIAVVILLYFLLSQGKEHDTHKSELKEVVTDHKDFAILEGNTLQKIKEKDSSIAQQDIIIKDLMAERDSYRSQLDRSKNQAQRLAIELKNANDTTAFGRKVDSLTTEVENLVYLLNQYEHYGDSLTVIVEQQKEQYEGKDIERQKLYAELRRNYDNVYSKYTTLFEDNKSLRKDIRRERLKTKIAAVLALVAGGLMIVK